MRISELTRFPHPVLSPDSGDYASGVFDVDIRVEERPESGALGIDYQITLTEPDLRELVLRSEAFVGIYVRCADTFYSELRHLSWPNGHLDFAPGSLLNRVELRPFVWLEAKAIEWAPRAVNPEFELPIALRKGDILAVAPEYVISVGQAKFAPLESIFQLCKSPDLEEGRIEISLDSERIEIRAAAKLYDAIAVLRGQARGQPAVMAGVYLPALMDVLDQLQAGAGEYESRRWYQPFMAKCDANAIDLSNGNLLQSAQALLGLPISGLGVLTEGE